MPLSMPMAIVVGPEEPQDSNVSGARPKIPRQSLRWINSLFIGAGRVIDRWCGNTLV
jgi:hypothetical protein